MEVTGEKAINAPRDRVYGALHDADVLRRIMPGAQMAAANGDGRVRLEMLADFGQGPTPFVCQLEFYNEDPPAGCSVRGRFNGNDAGTLRGNAHIALASINESTTNLAYHVGAEAVGALAELPADELEQDARDYVARFLKNLAAYAEGRITPASAPAARREPVANPAPPPAATMETEQPQVTAAAEPLTRPARVPVKAGYDAEYSEGRYVFNDPDPTPDGYEAGPGYEPTPVRARDPNQPRVDTVPPGDLQTASWRPQRRRPALPSSNSEPGIGRWLFTALGVGIIAILLSDMF